MARLGPTGLVQLVTDIKNWVLSKIPTKTSQLTNDSNYLTSHQSLSNYSTLANTVKSISISGKTITVTPGSGSTYTLTTQDTNTDTLVTQNVSTTNSTYPILLCATADATANQGAKTSIFGSGVKVNPSTSTITATTFSGALTGNVTGNCSGSSGSCTGNAATATQFSANTTVALTGDVTGTASSKAGWSVATTLANSGVTAGTYGPSANVTGNEGATIVVPEITVDAKGRVTSVTNRTLTCKNSTYSVYNKTLTIQKNGTNVATFTSNSNADVTANITVPTKTSELTNDSGFITGVAWNDVTGKPSNYTPATHTHTTSDVTDLLNSAHDWTSYQQMACNPTIWNMKNTSITLGTTPSSNRYLGFIWYDSADTDMGRFTVQCHKNGNNYYVMSLKNSDGTTTYDGGLRYSVSKTNARAFYPDVSACDLGLSNGPWANTYTTNLTVSGTGTCTTPATGDNSTNIATTAFVKAQGYLTAHQSLSGYAALASNNRFTSGQIISGNYMGNESSTNARTCITFQSNRDTNGKSGVFFTKFRQNVAQGSMGSGDLVRLSLDILENEVRSNDSFMFRWSGFNSDVATAISFCPSSVPTTRWLGTSSNRWTTIYGVDGNFSGTITGSITGTAKGLATSEPMTNETLTYNEGQLTIGSAAGNAYSGSSGTFSLISFPANGTLASNGVANIQNIRLPWATDAKYWHDIFVSPNNNYVWHRDVRKGTGNGWRRLVEENVSGLTNQTWDISIGGTSANVTGTVAIANGGTGATTRLNAVKNLTSEDVGTSTQYFLTITQNWGKAGYCSVANAKSVLGIPVSAIATRTSTAMGTWTVSCTEGALALVVIQFTLTSGGGGINISSGGIVFSALKVAPTSAIITYSTTGIWQYSGESSTTIKVRALIASIASSVKFSISGIACSSMSMTVYQ